MKIVLYFIITLVALTGCKTIELASATPAVIPEHNPESLLEIKGVITKALNGREATIGKTPFNSNHRLLIQRKLARDNSGQVIRTRVDEAPIIFELYLSNNICYVLDTRNQAKHVLSTVKCIQMSN